MSRKRTISTLITTRVIAALAMLLIALHSSSGVSVNAQSAGDPTGSWLITVTPAGPAAPPPFKVVSNFTADGGFTASGQGDIAVDGVATSAYGAWSRAAGRRFDMTFLQIIYQPKDPFAIPLGTFKLRQTINLNESGNEWSGPFKGDVFDPAGKLVFSSGGTATATRLRVEPLP